MRNHSLRRLAMSVGLVISLALSPMAQGAVTTARSAAPVQRGEPPIPGIGGDLALQDVDGRDFTLASLGERQALVFFGFTKCSSICPMAFYQIRQLLAYFQAKTPPAVIFVTLDPLNDDGPTLARYLAAFDPRIIGLTGHPNQIFRTAKRYAVGMEVSEGQIEHSAKWYLVNAQGQVKRVYDIDTPPHDMAQDIQSHSGPTRVAF
jgi:protein SCO1